MSSRTIDNQDEAISCPDCSGEFPLNKLKVFGSTICATCGRELTGDADKKSKTAIVPVSFYIRDLIEVRGWDHFWEKFEELWNARADLSEKGRLVDCGIRQQHPAVTINITAEYSTEDE
jgi:hypothetical protein